MLDIKKVLAKLLNNQIKTKTITATTTSTGAVELPVDVRSGFLTAWTNNLTCICTRRDEGYLMIRDAQTFGAIANRRVIITIKYVVGGVLLNSIFKAFSHLQKIGGGVDAGREEDISEDISKPKDANKSADVPNGVFDLSSRWGAISDKCSTICKRIYAFMCSGLELILMVCSSNTSLNKRNQYTLECKKLHELSSSKQLDSFLYLIHPERFGLTPERGWVVC